MYLFNSFNKKLTWLTVIFIKFLISLNFLTNSIYLESQTDGIGMQ